MKEKNVKVQYFWKNEWKNAREYTQVIPFICKGGLGMQSWKVLRQTCTSINRGETWDLVNQDEYTRFKFSIQRQDLLSWIPTRHVPVACRDYPYAWIDEANGDLNLYHSYFGGMNFAFCVIRTDDGKYGQKRKTHAQCVQHCEQRGGLYSKEDIPKAPDWDKWTPGHTYTTSTRASAGYLNWSNITGEYNKWTSGDGAGRCRCVRDNE